MRCLSLRLKMIALTVLLFALPQTMAFALQKPFEMSNYFDFAFIAVKWIVVIANMATQFYSYCTFVFDLNSG